jgi:hypothetical protein
MTVSFCGRRRHDTPTSEKRFDLGCARDEGLKQAAMRRSLCARFANQMIATLRTNTNIYALHPDDVTPLLPPPYGMEDALAPLPPHVEFEGYRFVLGMLVSGGSEVQTRQLVIAPTIIKVEPVPPIKVEPRSPDQGLNILNLSWTIATLSYVQPQVLPSQDWLQELISVVKEMPLESKRATNGVKKELTQAAAWLALALDDRVKALYDRAAEFNVTDELTEKAAKVLEAVQQAGKKEEDAGGWEKEREQFAKVSVGRLMRFLEHFSDEIWGSRRDIRLIDVKLDEIPASREEIDRVARQTRQQLEKLLAWFEKSGESDRKVANSPEALFRSSWVTDVMKWDKRHPAAAENIVAKAVEANRLGLLKVTMRDTPS